VQERNKLNMDKQRIGEEQVEKELLKIMTDFYEAYYISDRLKMFSYLDTSFQKNVPLNYFLIHEDFNAELGDLLKVDKIKIEKDDKCAFAECLIRFNQKEKQMVIVLKKDLGGWKIDGKSIFKRKL